jgi:hypothetical protein
MKTPAIIVDLDGTLANCEARRLAATKPDGKLDWKIFFEGMENDLLNEWCAKIMQSLYLNFDVIIVTGRGSEHKEVTNLWLKKHSIYYYNRLLMRPAGDYRPDTVIKKEIYESYIAPFHDVLFCIDDRKSVVDMWRSLGLVCLQCDEGNF